jgi:polysaccharide biosynthesis/export protein
VDYFEHWTDHHQPAVALYKMSTMKKLLFLCAVSLLLSLVSGCRHAARTPAADPRFSDMAPGFTAQEVTNRLDPKLLQPNLALFTLGPSDRLEIEILGHPQTRAVTLVGPDGKLYYNLAPGLDVWGLTLDQARSALEKEISKYMAEPQVVLTLREVGSKYVWLVGRLNRPGIYPISTPLTLLEAVSLAGGTARSTSQYSSMDLADLRHSFVMRHGELLPVDFYRLLHDGDTSQNIVLQPDDFVFVRSVLSQEVYVLGAVNFPRAVPYSDQMTLIGALAGGNGPARYDYFDRYTGGFPRDARLSHVAIVRGSLTQPKIAVVDAGAIIKGGAPDVPLEPGDIIYVPNSPMRFVKSYLNLILDSFVTTVAANEGIRAAGGEVGVGVSVPVGGR